MVVIRHFLFPLLLFILVGPLQGATLVNALTLRAKSPTCSDFANNPPLAVTTFGVTERAVTLEFAVTGQQAGDIASVDYVNPLGQIYALASGPWAPLTATDSQTARQCFVDDALRIAAGAAATPGQWSARIYYNKVLVRTLTFSIAGPSGAPSVTLGKATTLRAKPSGCTEFVTNAPPAITAFTLTDPAVALAFAVTGHKNGDVAAVEYITPSGQVYTKASGAWDPLSNVQGGSYCYWDDALTIAGASPALQPGQWAARIYYNNLPLQTLSFAIGGGTSTCTYAISPGNNSFTAEGGKGTVNVTTATGCVWQASTPVTWISITAGSSGSGRSFMEYTVTANLTSAERRATLTVAGEPHTVIQAGGTAVPAPELREACVVNQADGSAALAPGTPMLLCGLNLAARSEASESNPLPAELAGVSVEVTAGGVPYAAPLFGVSPTEIRAQMPFEVTGNATVRVKTPGGTSQMQPVTVTPRAPRLLTANGNGDGMVLAANANGEQITAENPAKAGEVVTIYAIGLGATDPPARTGQAGSGSETVPGVTVRINGENAAVSLAVQSTEMPGYYEIRLTVPGSVVTGHYKLVVNVDGSNSQTSATLPAGEKEAMLAERTNTQACSLTGRSPIKLEKDAFVSRLSTWYQWAGNESQVGFTLNRGGTPVLTGLLQRAGCDPYQQSWCLAETPVMSDWKAGEYELVTERKQVCANTQSENLGFFYLYGAWRDGESWRTVQTAVADAAGAVLEGEGLRMEIPGGAFAEPAELKVEIATTAADPATGVVTPFYRIQGLPDSIASEITVSLDAPNTSDGPVHVLVKPVEEMDRGPMVLPAEARAGRIYVTLPARTPPSGSFGSQSKDPIRSATLTGSDRFSWMLWAMAGVKPNSSKSGKFILFAPSSAANLLKPLDEALERGWDSIEASGLKWSRRDNEARPARPIEVFLFSYSSWGSYVLGGKGQDSGSAETGVWSKENIGLCFNLDLLGRNDATMWEEVRRTAVHELLHVLAFSYSRSSAWLALEEASAVYLERLGSIEPDAVSGLADADRNAAFLIDHPLHWEPSVNPLFSRLAVQRHGYGMSLLLQHLAPVENLPVKSDPNDPAPVDTSGVPKVLGQLFGFINEGSAVDALERVFPDFNSRWLEFSLQWMNGNVYSKAKSPVPNLNSIAVQWPAKMMADDGPWSLTLPKGEAYIGALHEVRLDYMTFPSKGQLKFTLTGPSGNVVAHIFQRRGNTASMTSLAKVTVSGEWILENAGDLVARKDPLIILLVRGQSTGEVVLSAQKQGETKYFNPLRLDFSLNATCGTRDCSVYVGNTDVQTPTVDWPGTGFQLSGKRSSSSSGCTNTSEYSVSGEMTANRSRVTQVRMTETGKSVCREKTTTVTTSVTAGPLSPTRSFIWSDKPAAEYAFEGLFPSGFQSFDQDVQITYLSEFMPPEHYHFTSASGAIKLKFLEK